MDNRQALIVAEEREVERGKENEKNAFIKACKKTKWTDGKHKGVNKSGRTCRKEWAELKS